MVTPIRMCISCRKRLKQSSLIRLQCQKKELVLFSGIGRSFYLCSGCVFEKKTVGMLSNRCKVSKENIKERLEKLSG